MRLCHEFDAPARLLRAGDQQQRGFHAAPLNPVLFPDHQHRVLASGHVGKRLIQHRLMLALVGGRLDHVPRCDLVLVPIAPAGEIRSLVLFPLCPAAHTLPGRCSFAQRSRLHMAGYHVDCLHLLDATVVNVALPSIARSLSFPAGGLQWVVTAYVLASGGLVLLGGRAADVAGRRRIFLAGLALFTAASLASGIAPAAGALIAARAGQGLGAALLTPAALSIITTSYAGAQRVTALGVWGAIGGAGAAVGVLAGGILTTWLGWRSVFLVNVPVGVVAGLLSLHLVPRHRPRRRFVRELDLPGAVLAGAGLVMLAYTLAGAPAHGWGSARTLLLLALALALLAGFAAVERSARRPLVPAELWRARSLVAGVLVMFGATGILVGTFFLNSLYLQDVQRASPLRVGLEFLPLALVIGAGAHLASRLLPRAGSRALIVAGLVVMGAGALLLTGVSARSGYLTGFLPGLLVVGMGAAAWCLRLPPSPR